MYIYSLQCDMAILKRFSQSFFFFFFFRRFEMKLIYLFQSLNYDVCENMIYQQDEKAQSTKVFLTS